MSGPTAMTCAEVRDRLPLVPGADLLPEEDLQVRAHLAGCVGCRKELGGYVRVRRELRRFAAELPASPATAAEAGSHEAFFADLRADTLAAVRAQAGRSRRSRRPRPVSGTASRVMTAAALFLIAVYLVSQRLPEPSGVGGLLPKRVPVPVGPVVDDGRFQNLSYVGYGLSGHQPRLLDDPVIGLLVNEAEAPDAADGTADATTGAGSADPAAEKSAADRSRR